MHVRSKNESAGVKNEQGAWKLDGSVSGLATCKARSHTFVFSTFIEMLCKCAVVGDATFSQLWPPSSVRKMRP